METRVSGLRQELFGEALIINVRLVGAILKCHPKTRHAKHPKSLRFSGKNMKYGTWQLCLIKFRQHQFPSSAADVTTLPKAALFPEKCDKCTPSPCPLRRRRLKNISEFIKFSCPHFREMLPSCATLTKPSLSRIL